MKKTVLFVCIHNSARSQMAGAWLKNLCGEYFAVESAGIDPGTLNPLVVKAMAEVGIDISGNQTKGVAELIEVGKRFDYVITVCDQASAERCPIFPGNAKKLHWSLPDPAGLAGTDEEKLAAIREIRDDIKSKVEVFCADAAKS
ncbi:MAG: arsenate reductase ArsC [Smithellaceae bacterium]|nr:arsenate reductase ArsC [Smithellaceae bacterium]